MNATQNDSELIKALRAAAGAKMTREQIRAQKVSFVMATVSEDNNVTRADVERIIDANEGEAA